MAIDITNKNEKKVNLNGKQIENALLFTNEYFNTVQAT